MSLDRFGQYHAEVQKLLRELRIASGKRQEDVAEGLHVPQSFVSKYECGERRLDIVEIRTLCGFFGLSLVDFASRLEDKIKGINQ